MKKQTITEAELAVLEVVWERDVCTIRQIADVLYPKGGFSAYTTVQKLLERLEKKKFVKLDGLDSQNADVARSGNIAALPRAHLPMPPETDRLGLCPVSDRVDEFLLE